MSETAANSVTLRFLAAPTDVGHSGSVDAGTVLEWVDKAAYAAAVGWAKSYCVTAYVGNIHFADPVNSGDMVEVEATIVYTGRSSMHIRTVVSSGDPKGGPATMRSQCMVIFVAVGEDGKPIPVPQFEPVTPEEIEQRDHALARIKVREEIVEAMNGQEYTDAGTAERVVAAVHGRPHGRELGRQGPRRHRHEVDRRSRLRLRLPLLREGHGGGVLRRRAVLPAAADRPRGGGGGPAGLHRHQGHAHRRPCPLRATPRGAN